MDPLVASPRGEADFEHPYWEDGDDGFLLLLTSTFATLAKFRQTKNTWYTTDSVSMTFGEVSFYHFHGIEWMQWISLPSTPTIDRDQGSRVRIWLLGSLGLLLVWMGRMHRMGGLGGSLNESEVVYTLLLTGMSERSIESRDQALYKGPKDKRI